VHESIVERLDLSTALLRPRIRRDTETDTVQFAQAALAAAKQEGLQLAVRARYVALAVIACLLPVINPTWEQLYYVVVLGLFALIGWGQVRVGRVGVSRPELALLFCDLERERGNLARYFSPNVVEELSRNDEPLKQVRTQNVAVLFVDIAGFTAFADARTPEEVVRTLREFHALMEREVFRHNGTLDKYLGDGLMATFGTPFVGKADASNALRCAQAMMATANSWNGQRKTAGEAPIRVSFGLHYGPVVLGDIGLTRLEFAVIGSTVNAASRIEALTRALDCALVASDALVERAKTELGSADAAFRPLAAQSPQTIRGLEQPIAIWIQARAGK